MKWNQKSLLRAGNQIAKAVGERDFEGKNADEFVAWLKGLCEDAPITYNGLIDHSDFDADAIRKAWKAVTITPDAGEEIIVNEPEPTDTESMDEDEDENVKMADEDEEVSKAYKAIRKAVEKNGAKNFPGLKGLTQAAGGKGVGFRFGDRLSSQKSAYDAFAREGRIIPRTGKTPMFESAERCEWFGAAARLVALDGKSYSQRAADERIVAKTGVAGQNGLGGALVFYETVPELIENFEEGGVARKAIGITSMRDGEQTVSKLHSDVTVYDGGEAETLTASDILTGNVKLVADKSHTLAKESNELLEDSAFAVGEIIARSSKRAMGIFEDNSVFLGSNNRQGVSDLVGPNTTFDAALSSDWSDYTITDIQDWLGKLPGWAWSDPKFAIVCSLPFYMRVLRRFALGAGGNTGGMVLGGVAGAATGPQLEWDGIPVHIAQVMPKSYVANQLVAYAGAWSYSSKMGIVRGSEQLDTSDQRYWDEDVVAFRMKQRWTFNGHDVNNTAFGSGLVALKD